MGGVASAKKPFWCGTRAPWDPRRLHETQGASDLCLRDCRKFGVTGSGSVVSCWGILAVGTRRANAHCLHDSLLVVPVRVVHEAVHCCHAGVSKARFPPTSGESRTHPNGLCDKAVP